MNCFFKGSTVNPLHNTFCEHGLAQHGLAQHGLAQHGLAQHGLAQHGLAQHGLAQHGLAQHGLAQHGLAQHGLHGTLGRPPDMKGPISVSFVVVIMPTLSKSSPFLPIPLLFLPFTFFSFKMCLIPF
uniref:Uncharacterized protein n=1 Tax=Callorhinchus milii TaxID=7868 RepID=A0A4W3HEW3_CALMI